MVMSVSRKLHEVPLAVLGKPSKRRKHSSSDYFLLLLEKVDDEKIATLTCVHVLQVLTQKDQQSRIYSFGTGSSTTEQSDWLKAHQRYKRRKTEGDLKGRVSSAGACFSQGCLCSLLKGRVKTGGQVMNA